MLIAKLIQKYIKVMKQKVYILNTCRIKVMKNYWCTVSSLQLQRFKTLFAQILLYCSMNKRQWCKKSKKKEVFKLLKTTNRDHSSTLSVYFYKKTDKMYIFAFQNGKNLCPNAS